MCVDEGVRNPGIAESSGERTAAGPETGWETEKVVGHWLAIAHKSLTPFMQ